MGDIGIPTRILRTISNPEMLNGTLTTLVYYQANNSSANTKIVMTMNIY